MKGLPSSSGVGVLGSVHRSRPVTEGPVSRLGNERRSSTGVVTSGLSIPDPTPGTAEESVSHLNLKWCGHGHDLGEQEDDRDPTY